MTLYRRYLNGETNTVYDAIAKLGPKAFDPAHYADIQQVLAETFDRVAYNLEVIYEELVNMNYLFRKEYRSSFERPLTKPFDDTEQLLEKLELAVKPFGYVPESLKMFYRKVGGCNFGWDYDTNEDYFWEYADPIQVAALDDLVDEVTDPDWQEDMRQYFEEDQIAFLELAADYYHKDNASGGPPYSMQITPRPSIDGLFLNEEHNTTFIDYLRITFDNCGFSRITHPACANDYQELLAKVKPRLLKI